MCGIIYLEMDSFLSVTEGVTVRLHTPAPIDWDRQKNRVSAMPSIVVIVHAVVYCVEVNFCQKIKSK